MRSGAAFAARGLGIAGGDARIKRPSLFVKVGLHADVRERFVRLREVPKEYLFDVVPRRLGK